MPMEPVSPTTFGRSLLMATQRPPRVVVARARRAEVDERGSCAADTRRSQHTEAHVRVEVEGRRGRWRHNTPAPHACVAYCMHWTRVMQTAMYVARLHEAVGWSASESDTLASSSLNGTLLPGHPSVCVT